MQLLKIHVLVVDDNPTDRLIVSSILKQLKVTLCQAAEDGSIAISKLQNAVDIGQPYDLVVLDWNMPGTSGAKIIQHIKNTSQLKNTKTIVMTATANLEVVETAISLGADDFIVKPVAVDLLKAKIEKIFEKSSDN